MPKFGRKSKERLNTCDKRIQKVMNEVIKHVDITILCGHRNEVDQNKAVESGNSKAKWPKGRHNKYPSLAIDIAIYDKTVPGGVDWHDKERFTLLAGFVLGIAKSLDIELIWGNDWDGDFDTKDTGFRDYPHFEIRE